MASEYGVVEFLSTSNEPNIGIPELEGLSCCCGTIFVPRFTENFVYHFTFGLRCSERYTTLGKIAISIRRKSSLPRQEYFASRVSSTLNLSPCLRLYPSSVPRSTSSFFSSLLSSPLPSAFPLFFLSFFFYHYRVYVCFSCRCRDHWQQRHCARHYACFGVNTREIVLDFRREAVDG